MFIASRKAVDRVKVCNALSEIRNAIGAQSFVVESFPFALAAVLTLRNDPEKCLGGLAVHGSNIDTNLRRSYGYVLGL